MIDFKDISLTVPPNIPRTNKAIKKYLRKLNREFTKLSNGDYYGKFNLVSRDELELFYPNIESPLGLVIEKNNGFEQEIKNTESLAKPML